MNAILRGNKERPTLATPTSHSTRNLELLMHQQVYAFPLDCVPSLAAR
jgi:hypothetical protein